jgi:hypothetical protein
MSADAYKKLHEELRQKLSDFEYSRNTSLHQLFEIYPHVYALEHTLDNWINTLVTKEESNDEAKSVLFREYNTLFYSNYRKELDSFSPTYWSQSGRYFSTLFPNADMLFLSLNPMISEMKERQERREKPKVP